MTTDVSTFPGYDRGARGVGVRDLVISFPSVGCTNRTVELFGRARPDLQIINHQHGCGLLGDDLTLTTEILAGLCANPNVRAAVIIGLGCETNQSGKLAARAAALGANVAFTVFQEAGGADKTIAAASALADGLVTGPSLRVDAAPSVLKVGLLSDHEAGADGERLRAAIAERLSAIGALPLDAGEIDSELRAVKERATRVYQTWRDRRHLPVVHPGELVRSHSEVEQLSAFAAAGCQLAAFVTGRGSPLGSPVVPTLKVGVNPSIDGRLHGIIDVEADPADAESSADRVVHALLNAAAGRPVAAEEAGQRDFGIPRVAPTM